MKKAETHSFEVALVQELGGSIEKAILLGNFAYWIGENEARQSGAHFREGEYWTHWTGAELVEKYPYLKLPSIYRWLDQLEKDGWIKTGKFNERNIEQKRWYARGAKLCVYLGLPIYQNEKSEGQPPIYQNDNSIYQNEKSGEKEEVAPISQNENPISHFENPIYQNENPISQNDNRSIYIGYTSNTHQTPHLLKKTREEILSVEVEEVLSGDLYEDPAKGPHPPFRAPPAPVADPPGQDELTRFTQQLQTDSILALGLRRQFQFTPEQSATWIAQFVHEQWKLANLEGRKTKDLRLHCHRWIKTQLSIEHEQQQRQSNHTGRRGGRATNGRARNQAATGAEIDSLVDEYYAN